MLRTTACLLTAILLSIPAAPAQATPAEAAQTFAAAHRDDLVHQFSDFLAIPNVAADPDGLRRNADLLLAQLHQRNIDARLLTPPSGIPSQTPSVVYGHIDTPGATHTIVFYAHYDGQPVTPSEWEIPPFSPTVRDLNGEPRIYARSAGDDKAAIFAQLTALDALRAAHLPLHANIRFVWEGEEEAGSPHLEPILQANADAVHGDIFLVCDGPVDQSGAQTVVFGARGDTHLAITLYGPHHGLHSGHYGNWAPNPALMLAQLLAGMKDENGRVLIPHFYDGIAPLSPAEKAALARAPVNDPMLMNAFWLGRTENAPAHLLSLLNQPSLNINGISSGATGAHAANVIPPTATADLDLRLVVGNDWHDQQQRVVDYVRSRGYFIVDREPTQEILTAHPRVALIVRDQASYNAVRTPMDLPMAQEVIAAVEGAHHPVVLLPTMGGSVPLGAMERAAHTRTITVPIANYDDNQHAANENLRLKNLWDGVETMAALLEMK
ncbi:MAG TPA: M20/M25/M40 family metallo-hydrolase [Acidobacteriaceae bacterium]|jgi:acetylornithine deacetylase/succinyl-diaminopimelate desuccinylase-like protein|nr:M20/M25/M40 family metallo-hydrolase [Acidobacteriaceae bacterium]